jgi:hypothetical protein
MSEEKKSPPRHSTPAIFYKGLPYTDENLRFTRFPDALIRAMDIKGVRSSFWKFTLVAFRHLMIKINGKYPYEFTFTHAKLQNEYGLRSAAVSDFVYWYEVSGLFKIFHGYRSKLTEKGVATTMVYFPDSTAEDWFIFVNALGETYTRFKKAGKATSGKFHMSSPEESGGKTDARIAFQISLAVAVDNKRRQTNVVREEMAILADKAAAANGEPPPRHLPRLPMVNELYLKKMEREGHIHRNGDQLVWSTPRVETFLSKQLIEV